MSDYLWILFVVLYIVLAPFIGGMIAGIDRKITARMQGRYGPPLLQPFYDVLKLMQKENIVVNKHQKLYVLCSLIFIIVAGAIFFAGGDLLLSIFALALASIFLVIAAYSTYSPYAYLGAERELIQIMAYEPMVILTIVGMYIATGSFSVTDIGAYEGLLVLKLPAMFVGFVYILTIKIRKSPFDISMSHHAHQEIVRGLTTEFSGKELAYIEISHWYENVMLLGLVYLFFASNPILAVLVLVATYFLEILIDNVNSRLKWQSVLFSTWLVAFVLGIANIAVLGFLKYFL
ncbi:MAG: NADH-quinone oxidoreductase subunit H [Peptococcaceae bacterium]|nr:NADH-quinone oxidoreductase subunit H [Peptococcaceae bacterium]